MIGILQQFLVVASAKAKITVHAVTGSTCSDWRGGAMPYNIPIEGAIAQLGAGHWA